ncbi:aldehyde dehydrogenase [Clostridium niameyense]|uniref:aldehyde dehydrogenase n=1 Tax=Clostridium niameyense TaxID=1622073 RepID=UPI00067ED570|nr:aldehyde dehydrogenase [Clostridium niameyense]
MENIKTIIKNQREFFSKGNTKNIEFRIKALKELKSAIKNNEQNIFMALKKDLNKSEFETYSTEIGIVYDEINLAIKNINKWSKPKRVKTPITNFLSSSYIYKEPYGVVLIISPWNYPFQLLMAPLVGAIEAGNCAILKPSEIATETEKVIVKIIKETFEQGYINVVTGGVEINTILLKEKFDYIFFTGAPNIGKIVMKSASENLTPVTLELGGKSPCIIDRDVDIKLAAKRITWGKFLNAGQTCVAPDYILIHKDVKKKFVIYMKEYIKEFFGSDPSKSSDYPRIINEKHFKRLENYLKEGRILIGGRSDIRDLYIEPTIIDSVDWNSKIMQEEIFGPLFPIMEYEDLDNVIKIINKRPKPLALYFFSKNKEIQDLVINSVSFGGGCINDTIMHLATPHLPFGGVGNSGMGGYHGEESFNTFSHKKSVLKKSNIIDVKVRYAPYKDKIKILRKLMK